MDLIRNASQSRSIVLSTTVNLFFLPSILSFTPTTSRDPVNKTSMASLKVIADCGCQAVYTHTHNLNTVQSYLTFPSTGMKIVNMTS